MLVLPHHRVRLRNLRPGEDPAQAWVDAALQHETVGRRRLLQVREMRSLDALLPHPDVARIERDIEAGGAGAEHDHAAALDDHRRDREGRFARMLEHDIDVALTRNLPDRFAETPRFLGPLIVFGRVDLRQLTPAIELLAVDDALGA